MPTENGTMRREFRSSLSCSLDYGVAMIGGASETVRRWDAFLRMKRKPSSGHGRHSRIACLCSCEQAASIKQTASEVSPRPFVLLIYWRYL
jgi:hypothetical protein